MNHVARFFTSVRQRGLRSTLALVVVKAKALFELFLPRTVWGEHIGLRSDKSPLTDAEVERTYEWARDREILESWGGTPTEMSLAQFRNKARRDRWRLHSDERSFFIVNRTGELIGRIRLYSIDWISSEGEMGIFLDKRFWGKQYGREALKLLEQYVFAETPINRIYLLTFKDNVRAQRSFEACGFRNIGITKRYLSYLDKQVDHIRMEIRRDDFMRTANRNGAPFQ